MKFLRLLAAAVLVAGIVPGAGSAQPTLAPLRMSIDPHFITAARE